jgi:hypothetical protein
MIVLLALLLQDTVTFQMVKETRRHEIKGHVKAIPKRLEPFVDKWVTMSGFPILYEDGQTIRKVVIAENQYDLQRHYGTPPDYSNSVSVVYRTMPPKIREAKFLQVSGYLRFKKVGRKEGDREKLDHVWHLTEAVEGAVPNPDKPAEAPKEGTLTFALLESAQEASAAGEIKIPDAVQAYHGKWVTITGHVLLSWASEEITQFQLAKNPWDGCCMGVPPSYFNAVRVQMAPGKAFSNRFDRVGTLSGKFRAEIKKTENGYVDAIYWLDEAVEGAVAPKEAPAPGAAETPKSSTAWWEAAVVITLVGVVLFFTFRRKT